MKKGIVIAGLLAISFAILLIPGWFVYTRFLLPQYQVQGNTLTLQESIYMQKQIFEPSDAENVGNTIGIATDGARTITDLIWPTWVSEYRNDPDHNRIFVQGLMDVGVTYNKKNVR